MNTGARTRGFRLAVVADLINESKKEGRKKMLFARKLRSGPGTMNTIKRVQSVSIAMLRARCR